MDEADNVEVAEAAEAPVDGSQSGAVNAQSGCQKNSKPRKIWFLPTRI